ncbi:hypothetical protein OP10G_3649 [Fimbriimonas ginsengisoli Gsoil 348]|uniref:Uncharacterized protein n=1 Tax=Fimbriimonas ginsengisoli Gsoil 348 TaxID=661478 RepID=A0A068NUI9_FIMGI|nr:hypothetical protein OP10G_3649 [Fimbriimonas ginsengisoli Gsoil 348]
MTPPAAKPQVKAGGKVQNGGVFDGTVDPAPPGVQTGTK